MMLTDSGLRPPLVGTEAFLWVEYEVGCVWSWPVPDDIAANLDRPLRFGRTAVTANDLVSGWTSQGLKCGIVVATTTTTFMDPAPLTRPSAR